MIIVTGGAGFIGSAVVWGLNRKNIHDIIIVDHLGESPKWKNLVNLKFADYLDRDDFLSRLLNGEFSDIKGIIHLGAITDTTERDFQKLLTYNYEYSKELASWCIEYKKRMIYASSAATYGDGKNDFKDQDDDIFKLKPLNPYGFSKQMFDNWAYRQGFLKHIAGMKFFNVFGPNEYHKGEMRSLVHKAFGQIKETGKVRLFKSHIPEYEDGGQLRDFVYVKDVVDMTIWLYQNKEVNGLFNIGTGEARSFADLAKATFAALKLEPNIEYIDMPLSIRNQYQYYTQAEMHKLRQAGFSVPPTSLENAVTDYVCNYLATNMPYLND